MRTSNGGEAVTLASANYRITPRIKVANGSGTMIDLTSYMESISIDHDVDQPVGGATVTFRRDASSTLSLAPLRTDSTLNVNDAAAYSPLLDLNRSVTIEVATTTLGSTPSDSRTNLLLWNNDFANAVWSHAGTTVTAGIADPLGGTTASTLTSTGPNLYTTQNLGVGSSLARTNSIWIRRRTGTGNIRLVAPNSAETIITVTSTWQRFSVTGAVSTGRVFAVRIDTTGNEIDVWRAQMEEGTTATDPIYTTTAAVTVNDYKLMFKGTIDVVNFERSPVSIICRDLGAPLVDRWIEAEATYGSGGGTAIQTVMQSILDDVFGGGAYTLYVPVSPGFNVITYRQQKMSERWFVTLVSIPILPPLV